MKKQDLIFILCIVVALLPFFLSSAVFEAYSSFNGAHGMITSFIKFAILATLGEVIGLRISQGVYNKKGFGIMPRAIVWGCLGLAIKMCFMIFIIGIPQFLQYMGLEGASVVMKGDLSLTKVFVAFCISVSLNTIFAPVMMTFHKITDTHIIKNGGTLAGFFTPIKFAEMFKAINWDIQWGFVFKKTIPFFWYPAHTITFLLPAEYQVLFAALLGVALGIILAFASLKQK
jgi:hypothetical protein